MASAGAVVPACADAVFDSVPSVLRGETSGGADNVGPASCVQNGTDGSNDFVAYFVAPSAGWYRFSTVGSNFDTVLHLRAGDCTGDEVGCNDDSEETASAVEIELQAGQSIVAIVDGFNRAEGQVTLRIETKETRCDDMLDNDQDGQVDCADIDCLLTCDDPADWPADWADFEDEVLRLTNQARGRPANCGGEMFSPVPPLTMNRFARYAARLHSLDMSRLSYMDHVSRDGRTFSDRLTMSGYDGAKPWGENVARGQRSPEAVVEAWMNSPGHCRNIMDGDFRVIGIGHAWTDEDQYKAYWTQKFGASD